MSRSTVRSSGADDSTSLLGSPGFKPLLVATFTGHLNVGLLMSAVPLLASQAEGANAAGITTASLFAATVAAQLYAPTLLRQISKITAFHLGIALLTVPCAIYLVDNNPASWATYLSTAVRGLGFGLITISSAALAIEQAPARQTGAAIGAYGVVTAAASVAGPPLGLWIIARGPAIILAITAITAGLLTHAALRRIHPRVASPHIAQSVMTGAGNGLRKSMANPVVRACVLSFVLFGVAWGGTMTFLGPALPDRGLGSAASFLLVSGVFRIFGRWAGGRVTDVGAPPMTVAVAATCLAATGLLILALTEGSRAVLGGAAIYGVGSGAVMTLLYVAIHRQNPTGHNTNAALWATAVDSGSALGSGVLGAAAVVGGYEAILWLMPLTTFAAVALLWPHRRTSVV